MRYSVIKLCDSGILLMPHSLKGGLFMRRFLLVFVLLLIVSLLVASGVKNVIYMIGDGMGINHVLLTSYLEGRELYMLQAPYTGFVLTFSANSNVPDSAAAGTALACGYKTNNGMIGMLPDGKVVTNIAEIAAQYGIKTGIVATCRITHATPAAFYGHVSSRRDENTLAEQLVDSYLTVAFGGGWRHFVPTGGKRKDGKDLIAIAKANGFDYITTKTELLNYDGDRVLGLFSYSHLKAASERTGEEPMLPEMVEKALEILSKDDSPFFLMVEGSQIDWEAHGNDVYGLWKEIVEFDNAVKVALDFAKEHPNTLIVITADHETGGLGLSTGGYTMNLEKIRKDYTKTADWIVSNFGDSDEELKEAVKTYFNVELTDEDLAYYHEEKAKSFNGAGNAIGRILSNKAQIGWTTHDHTGGAVPIFAFGPGAELFSGVHDNTEIPNLIAYLLGIGKVSDVEYGIEDVPLVGGH